MARISMKVGAFGSMFGKEAEFLLGSWPASPGSARLGHGRSSWGSAPTPVASPEIEPESPMLVESRALRAQHLLPRLLRIAPVLSLVGLGHSP